MPEAFGIRYRVGKMVFLYGDTTKINVPSSLRYRTCPSTDEDSLLVSLAERANLKREIDAAPAAQADFKKEERGIPNAEELEDELRDDGSWYIGKAREEFRRRRMGEARREEEEDLVQVRCAHIAWISFDRFSFQWARDRRNAENERDGDFGPEDYFDAALRGGHRGEEGADEFVETMLLVGLCVAVAVLIYVRTRIMERVRREEQEAERPPGEQQRQNLGVFPPADDPARQDWLIWR